MQKSTRVADSKMFEARPEETDYKFPCSFPECARRFKTEPGMNHHATSSHGAPRKTKLYGKMKNKTKQKEKSNLPAIPTGGRKRKVEMLADGVQLNSELLLETIFPEGIPREKIRATVTWVEATSELTR